MKLGLNNKALKRLEPYEAKVSSTVVRPDKAGMFSEKKGLAETIVGVS